MADQYLTTIIDPMRSISFEPNALLTHSTINGLHFPGLSTSGIGDGSAAGRRTSFILDGLTMCESMTESYCSNIGHDDLLTNHLHMGDSFNASKAERKDNVIVPKKRPSRKSQFDASLNSPSLDKIEAVALNDDQNEADDVWLFRAPNQTIQKDQSSENIYSWVHKEFQSNDVHASKHRLLCKLDDMSNARTLRSVSCHNFLDTQRVDTFKRSSTDQGVHSEPLRSGRLSSPLRGTTPRFHGDNHLQITSPVSLAHSVPITNPISPLSTARDLSKDYEKASMDFTDVEVMAKVQLENLRQAEQQPSITKRFGGSSASLSSNSSGGTVVSTTRNKPPVAPKPTVTTRHATQSASSIRANPTTSLSKSNDDKFSIQSRTSVVPPNSANINNRTRPPIVARPLPTYRSSQVVTSNSSTRLSTAPSSVQRLTKRPIEDRKTPLKPTENVLHNDVHSKPTNEPIRSQVAPQRRTMMPATNTNQTQRSEVESSKTIAGRSSTLTRSSSSLSQGRKSGIPAVAANTQTQRTSTSTLTRHHSLTSRRTTMKGF